jgi:hypothetical protein
MNTRPGSFFFVFAFREVRQWPKRKNVMNRAEFGQHADNEFAKHLPAALEKGNHEATLAFTRTTIPALESLAVTNKLSGSEEGSKNLVARLFLDYVVWKADYVDLATFQEMFSTRSSQRVSL